MTKLICCIVLFTFTLGCVHAGPPYPSAYQMAESEISTVAAAGEESSSDTAAPLASQVADQPQVASAPRVMVYQAQVRLVVLNVSDAQRDIRTKAQALGGYLLQLDGDQITVRVPAAQLNAALEHLETLGEVTDRQLVGEDVTDQLRDLNIRLANATKARDRLLELVAKAQKVEDVLKIEQELTRLTEQIEQIKGTLAAVGERVRFATIRVEINSPIPQRQMAISIPFPWVLDLAGDMIAGTSPAHVGTGLFKPGIVADLPDSYIRYVATPKATHAMNAQGVLVRIEQHENYDGGDLDFWTTLCRRSLVEHRTIAITDSKSVKPRHGQDTHLFIGAKQIGGKPSGYLLLVTQTPRYVYTYQAWGPAEALDADRQKLINSAMSLGTK